MFFLINLKSTYLKQNQCSSLKIENKCVLGETNIGNTLSMRTLICVSNIPGRFTSSSLTTKLPSLRLATALTVKPTKNGTKLAFVGFKTDAQCEAFIAETHGTFLDTNRLRTEFAQTKEVEEKERPFRTLNSTALFVKNLSFRTTYQEAFALFSEFGEVVQLDLPIDKKDPSSNRGFVFLAYETQKAAEQAFDALDSKLFQGRRLVVEEGSQDVEVAPALVNSKNFRFAEIRTARKLVVETARKSWTLAFFPPKATALVSTDTDSLAVASNRREKASAEALLTAVKQLRFAKKKASTGKFVCLSEERRCFENNSEDCEWAVNVLAFEKTRSAENMDATVLLVRFAHTAPCDFPNSSDLQFLVFLSTDLLLLAFASRLGARNLFAFFSQQSVLVDFAPKHCVVRAAVLDTDKSVSVETRKEWDLVVKTGRVSKAESFLARLLQPVAEVVAMKRVDRINGDACFFVRLLEEKDASRAVRTLDKTVSDGLKVRVALFDPAKPKNGSVGVSVGALVGVGKTKVVIKNLPFQTNKRELKELVEKVCEVRKIRLPLTKKDTKRTKKSNAESVMSEVKRPKGYAFVEVAFSTDAEKLVAELNRTHLYGRRLLVEFAKE